VQKGSEEMQRVQIFFECRKCYGHGMATTPGLRERKKQQTREALRRAAWELFAERGYDATTLADIAEAAGVSTRTIFAYFPSKEDIVFCEFESMRDALGVALANRPAGQDALGALRDFIVSTSHAKLEGEGIERVIAADETLRSHKRARIAEFQDVVAAAIAVDLDSGPDDLRPQLAAASLTAAFEVLEREGGGTSHTPEGIAEALDPIIAFVRAGLNALPAG
jgi:AcrR family transcriptional regulator